jgi:hypothetical protein
VLAISSFVLAGIYFGLAIPVLHNVYKYLYLQQKWRVWLTTSFYVMAMTITLMRFGSYIEFGIYDAFNLVKTGGNFSKVADLICTFSNFTLYFYLAIS